MDLADNTLRVGDIIALSGSVLSFVVSYIRAQAKANATDEKLEEHRNLTNKWIADFRSRCHDMGNHITANNLRTAVHTERLDGQDKEIHDLKERQAYFDAKVLDKLERLLKDVSRIEGKIGMSDGR